MAPVLLKDGHIDRRTLGHDMESFFAVIVWMATFDYTDEAAFLAKPLAKTMLDRNKSPTDIINAKGNWFRHPEEFFEQVTEHFDWPYRKDKTFVKFLFNLREILYPATKFDLEARWRGGPNENDNKATADADPMKEGLFRKCMKEIDDYLHETKGCDEMKWIDATAAARHTPEGQ
jgi:hypothetical protein